MFFAITHYLVSNDLITKTTVSAAILGTVLYCYSNRYKRQRFLRLFWEQFYIVTQIGTIRQVKQV